MGKLGSLWRLLNLCEHKWNILNIPPQLPLLNLQQRGVRGVRVGGKRIEQAEPYRHQQFLT